MDSSMVKCYQVQLWNCGHKGFDSILLLYTIKMDTINLKFWIGINSPYKLGLIDHFEFDLVFWSSHVASCLKTSPRVKKTQQPGCGLCDDPHVRNTLTARLVFSFIINMTVIRWSFPPIGPDSQLMRWSYSKKWQLLVQLIDHLIISIVETIN